MRLAALAALALLLLVSCGRPERSVAFAPEPDRYNPMRQPVVSPVYRQPQATILAACVLACDSYCHDTPTLVDAEKATLHVVDRNGWTGDVAISVQLVALGDGATRMDLEASEVTGFIGDERDLQRKRLRGFIEHVERHLMVAGLRAAPTAAVPATGGG